MTLRLGLPGVYHRSHAEQQDALRAARKLLKERVRADWEYPTLPAHVSSGRRRPPMAMRASAQAKETSGHRIAGFKLHDQNAENADAETSPDRSPVPALGFEPVEWRERDCDASSDDSGDDMFTASSMQAIAKRRQQPVAHNNQPESKTPPSADAAASDNQQARKRKRQQAQMEECSWNDGLAHWIGRRDMWCCAHTPAEAEAVSHTNTTATEEQSTLPVPMTVDSSSSTIPSPRTSTSSAATTSTTGPSSSRISSSPSSFSANLETTHSCTTLHPPAIANPSTPSLSSQPSAHSLASANAPPSSPPSLTLLLPVAPDFLPHHPIRKKITPATYPEIYTKVILQSRTPVVPINLATMIGALIRGWKDDGEWPPKAAPPEKSLGKRKKGAAAAKAAAAKGTSASTAAATPVPTPTSAAGPREKSVGASTASSLKQGVRAVGRVLRITVQGDQALTQNSKTNV